VTKPTTPEERIRAVLRPGEALVWCGAPSIRQFWGEIAAYTLIGLLPLAGGLFFLGFCVSIVVRQRVGVAALQAFVFGVAIGGLFVIMGVFCLRAAVLATRRLSEVVYAVTDQRGLVLTSANGWSSLHPVPEKAGGGPLIEFTPDQLRRGQRKWRDFGRTDLVFDREWRKPQGGRGEWCYYGFLGLAELEAAEQAIRSQPSPETPADSSSIAEPGAAADDGGI